MKFSAVILAGGKSSRMGRDKAWLEVGGQSLLARQVELARETGAVEIFISSRSATGYSTFGCRVLQDKFTEAGPLAGIERALAAAPSPFLLVLAVDLPEMNAQLLQRLGARGAESFGAIPRVGGKIEPLAAFYPKVAQPVAEGLLRAGKNAVAGFAQQCVRAGMARFVGLPASATKAFANWNSPADLP